MRVAHLLRKYDPAEWGGTETAIYQLTAGLAAHGVESAVYAPRLGRTSAAAGDPFADSGSPVKRFRACLPVWGLSASRRQQLIAVGGNIVSVDLIWALWRDRKTDVIHSHVLGRVGAGGLRVARKRRIPFVATIHGGLYDLPASLRRALHSREGAGFDWGRILGMLLRARGMLDETDAVITCNPREADLIAQKHPRLRVMVQPHGVPAAKFAPDVRHVAQAAFPQVRGRRVLLMPGRVDPVKNQDWVLAQARTLAARHPDSLVVSVGPCTDAPYGDRVWRRIESERLGRHVLMAGKLPPGDPRLIGLMQLAEAVVLPSVSETFGLVILEAWAAGTPVISSRTSGASAMIEPGKNGWLFSLEKPEEFHAAVDQLFADAGRRTSYGEDGRRRVLAEFDSVVLAGRMRRLYDELRAAASAASTPTPSSHALRNPA